MITAVDSSVLISLVGGDASAASCSSLLHRCLRDGDLVICEVAAAEVGALYSSHRAFCRELEHLQIRFEPMGVESACLAGRIYREYRRQGGLRNKMVADFLVGAHAMIQSDRLATNDRGFMREYFRRLKIVSA